MINNIATKTEDQSVFFFIISSLLQSTCSVVKFTLFAFCSTDDSSTALFYGQQHTDQSSLKESHTMTKHTPSND